MNLFFLLNHRLIIIIFIFDFNIRFYYEKIQKVELRVNFEACYF